MKMAAPIALTISIVVLSIITLGFYDFLTNYEKNGCEMTYMYEYPEYVKVNLDQEVNKEFPHYNLYLYGEGYYAERIRNLHVSGIPVLFIPGNAGSYKQVRSLGSVSLRMSERVQGKIHFNYFVVDFNEELSGLYGGVLYKQTEYVHVCLKKILSAYKSSSNSPTSVILVGHSMGGMIARALFTLPDFDHSLVNTIITQATPHQRPVAAVDDDLSAFYTKVNNYWRDHAATSLRHVIVVSSGGSYRDIQVRYGLTVLDRVVAPDRAISVSTTAVPKAWVSTDHLCSVWCRQMVLLTKQAMFDIVDKDKLQVMTDADLRMKAFTHHFISNNGLSDYLSREDNTTITLDARVKWEVKDDKLWKYTSLKVASPVYLVVPFRASDETDSIFIQSNLTTSDWVCYCHLPEDLDRCSTCTSLSSMTRFLPPLYSNSKYVRVKDIARTNRTYIIILVSPKEKKVDILVDHYDSNIRHLVYQMPNVYDTILSYPISATDGTALLRISNASSFYSLHLAGLSLPTNAYSVVVTPNKCRKHNSETYEGSVLRLKIPWSHEDVFSFSSYGKEASLAIKLQTGRPANMDWLQDTSEPHLEMFLHPYCHYQLKLLVSTQDALGQGIRFYALLLPGCLVAVLFMTLRSAVLTPESVKTAKSGKPYSKILESGKPFYVVPFVLLACYLSSFRPVGSLLKLLHFPKDDMALLKEENIYFSLLPLLLYICSWVLTYLHSVFAYHGMKTLSYIGRLLAVHRIFGGLSERAGMVQAAVCCGAVGLTYLCGTLGLLLTSALVILKCLRLLYVIGQKLDTTATHHQLSLMFPVALLVNLQTLLNITPLVVWIKLAAVSDSIFHRLGPDPSQLPALATCLCVFILLSSSSLSIPRFQSVVVGWTIHCLAVATIMFTTVSLFRLPSFIALVLFILALPHCCAAISRMMGRKKME